jgi:hypothetical protein
VRPWPEGSTPRRGPHTYLNSRAVSAALPTVTQLYLEEGCVFARVAPRLGVSQKTMSLWVVKNRLQSHFARARAKWLDEQVKVAK